MLRFDTPFDCLLILIEVIRFESTLNRLLDFHTEWHSKLQESNLGFIEGSPRRAHLFNVLIQTECCLLVFNTVGKKTGCYGTIEYIYVGTY